MAESKKIATRAAYGEFLVQEGANNDKLIVMDADLSGSTRQKNLPEFFRSVSYSLE